MFHGALTREPWALVHRQALQPGQAFQPRPAGGGETRRARIRLSGGSRFFFFFNVTLHTRCFHFQCHDLLSPYDEMCKPQHLSKNTGGGR